ncbi:MAG: ribonuclease III [Gemmataceae bacterium]|nr:ribonuclease III [Gemmataceae bacterium]MCS7271188.1 ribonuclease III [Gemmataceae bacterium]MDW8244079.1 ribonuclease III [Thermogemmata sp.]
MAGHDVAGNRETALLEKCQQQIGYRFRQLELLRAALTHTSGANTRAASNERLEFLGDSIVGLVVCEQLFHRFPQYQEGDLTKIKSFVVSRQSCAAVSRRLQLDRFLFLGKGLSQQGEIPENVLADVFEALVAAVYLDSNWDTARQWVLRCLEPVMEQAVQQKLWHANAKSELQTLAQREYGVTPRYQVLDEQGPDHSKCFKVAAHIGARSFAPAWGRTKKDAEIKAACNALAQLRGEPLPYPHG